MMLCPVFLYLNVCDLVFDDVMLLLIWGQMGGQDWKNGLSAVLGGLLACKWGPSLEKICD